MRPFHSMMFAVLGLATTTAQVAEETWPTRSLKAIVPIAAGSVLDVVPRLVFEELSIRLGQSIVVENRPGAGQTIGANAVATADPDGYTLLVNSSAHTIAPSLYPNIGYHPSRDFAAVTPLGVSPFVLVVPPARGFKTAREFVDAAKAKPGAFNFSSPGIGTGSHLSAELFRLSAGLQAAHVPFRGGTEALTEVLAGRVDFFFVALGAALPHIREGKLTALAVNSAKRSASLPDVPTTAEAGFTNTAYPTWFGLFLPAKTPRNVVDKLHAETVKALQEPKLREKLAKLGVEPMEVMTPGEFSAYVEAQIASDAALVVSAGLKP